MKFDYVYRNIGKNELPPFPETGTGIGFFKLNDALERNVFLANDGDGLVFRISERSGGFRFVGDVGIDDYSSVVGERCGSGCR